MKDLAYKQGMNKAAQEFGYQNWDAFEKDAGVPWGLIGRSAGGGALMGGVAGAGIGAVGGALSNDPNKGLLSRMGGGAMKGGLVGAGAGGALGAALPGAARMMNQRANPTALAKALSSNTPTRQVAQNAYGTMRRSGMSAPSSQQALQWMHGQ